jgi:hypothetical protein
MPPAFLQYQSRHQMKRESPPPSQNRFARPATPDRQDVPSDFAVGKVKQNFAPLPGCAFHPHPPAVAPGRCVSRWTTPARCRPARATALCPPDRTFQRRAPAPPPEFPARHPAQKARASPSGWCSPHRHCAAFAAIFHRVLQQIAEDLFQPRLIGVSDEFRHHADQFDVPGLGAGFEIHQHPRHQVQVHRPKDRLTRPIPARK